MKWSGAESLAVYAIGAKIGILMQFMNQAIQTAYPPAAFQIAKEPGAQSVFARLLRLQFVAMFFLAVALTAFGRELLLVFATHEYRDAYFVVPFIAFSYVFYGAGLNVLTGLAIVHKTAFVSVSACIAAALKLVLNAALIRPFGIYGARCRHVAGLCRAIRAGQLFHGTRIPSAVRMETDCEACAA